MEEQNKLTSSVGLMEAPTSETIEEKPTSKQQIDPRLLDPTKMMWKPIITFLTPLMLSNILQSLGGLISTVIIGRGLGETSLAAASTILPVSFFLISLVIGLSSGSLVLIGQAFGAGKLEEVRKTVDTTIKFSFLLGIMMGIIGLVFIEAILQMIGTPLAARPEAMQFGQIIFASLPFIFVYISYTTILRGTGDAKTPFLFLLVSTFLNIVLTPIFTFGWLGLPAMHLRGAAVANTTATVISFILLMFYLKWKKHVLALDRRFFQRIKLDISILKLLIQIGLPSSIQMIAVSLSEVAVIFLVNQHGAQATAAYGAAVQIINFVLMPMLSLGMAVGIFAAQLIGANASHRFPSLIRHSLALNYLIGVVVVVIVYLFQNPILRWFLHEPVTIQMSKDVLFVVLWSLIILGHAMILSSIMRGSGTVMIPTAITIFAIWVVMVPIAYVLSTPYGLLGIGASYPISYMFMLIVLYLYYRFVWKRQQHQSLFA